jgi:hypothetical protein
MNYINRAIVITAAIIILIIICIREIFTKNKAKK